MATHPLRVLALASDTFACAQWRLIQPFAAMSDERVTARAQVGGQVTQDSFDVAVFGRPLWRQHFEHLRAIKQWGKKLIVDYDDPFPLTDPQHPDFEQYSSLVDPAGLRQAIELADAVTVATPELVRHYEQMHRRVVCIPNAIDVHGPLVAPAPVDRFSAKVTLFWSGWKTHERNLRMILPAMGRLLCERDDVVLAICGPTEYADLFRSAAPAQKVLYVEPAPFETFIRAASCADVALAPLEPTAFNDNKSEIRLIEAGVWGVPAVASPAAAYKRFESGQGACLLAETPDQWYSQLKRLLDDPGLRCEVGRKAREVVESRYDLREVNRARVELLCSLA